MTQEETNYLRRRERQERAAAKAAFNTSARQAHQHLAECYAALLEGWPGSARCDRRSRQPGLGPNPTRSTEAGSRDRASNGGRALTHCGWAKHRMT